MSTHEGKYDIQTDAIMFAAGQHFDIAAIGRAQTPWWNRTLCAVNDAWIRLGVLEGDFHWHKHDGEDEFFLVLEGRLDIELEDRTVSLGPSMSAWIRSLGLPVTGGPRGTIQAIREQSLRIAH